MRGFDPRTHGPGGRPRGRGLGLPFPGETGPLNAITDVAGVEVGVTTLIEDRAKPVRTGVTAILPRGRTAQLAPVWAAMGALNGNGEMTGSHLVAEYGQFAGPLLITNTHSVGICHQAAIRWMIRQWRLGEDAPAWGLPVVAETYDGWLSDVNGLHVTESHALAAIDGAAPGPVPEGSVGGGTGMIAFEYKGGTGTASRRVRLGGRDWTVGVLVQANYGWRPWLTILGVPLGHILAEDRLWRAEEGSIIGVLATDLPLLPHQLKRLARRMGLGIARTGSPSGDSSGDIFLALSTANGAALMGNAPLRSLDFADNAALDPVFEATVDAIEEAVVNAMVAAEPMTGLRGSVAALPHDRLVAALAAHGRM